MWTLIKGFVSQFESMDEFLACSKLTACMVQKLVFAAFKAPSPSPYICYFNSSKSSSVKSNELSLPPKQDIHRGSDDSSRHIFFQCITTFTYYMAGKVGSEANKEG